CIGDDLAPAFWLVDRQRTAGGGEGELPFPWLESAFSGLVGAQADTGDLGVGEDHRRDAGRIVRRAGVAGDRRRRDQALVAALVREHRLAGAVADRPDARHAGLAALVDGDEALVIEGDADFLESDALAVRTPADRRQDHV